MTKLSIDQVSRTFPARQGHAPTRALEPTDLSVGDNDFVTILGPSGCGKFTLLRIIAGLDRPTSGRVILDGHEVAGPGADRGMVFQSYTLFPWLTVRETSNERVSREWECRSSNKNHGIKIRKLSCRGR